MRITRLVLFIISVLVRRKGRISIVGNRIMLQMGKSQVGERIQLLSSVSSVASRATILMNARITF